jgi:hypothetical protein
MDASMMTRLRQNQANIYTNRYKVQDASTLTWQHQMQASQFMPNRGTGQAPQPNQCATCPPQPTDMVSSHQISFQGSGGIVYTSLPITYQHASQNMCGCDGAQPIPTQASYITINTAAEGWCVDASGQPGQLAKLYLPPVDPYWQLKNPCFPTTDLNAKHFVGVDAACCSQNSVRAGAPTKLV